MPEAPLECPRCGRRCEAGARLCPECSMPLVVAGAGELPAASEAHEEARKIHPRHAHGELVRVAIGRNQAEAEMIKGMLLEQGIPSMLRRTGGFDVPDFLAAGPRDVLVPQSGAAAARELLAGAELAHEAARGPGPAPDPDRLPPTRSLQLRAAALVLAVLLAFGAIVGGIWTLVR